MSDRFRDALTGAWQRIEERQWLYGHLGKMNTDESYTLAVPGRKNFVYVTIRNSAGAQTAVPARNDAAVALEARIPVKMRLEKGVYVIVSRSGRTDLGSPLIPAVNPHAHALNDLSDVTLTTPADGDMLLFDTGFWVNTPFAHNHNDIYFTEAEFLDVSAGVGDAGKPIKLDAGGQIDATMINDADIDHGSIGGLADDDHSQYHTDARGDARYSLLAHSHTLDGLSDVVITTPAAGHVLSYDVGSGNWINATIGAATDHGTLSGLGDDDHTQYILADGTRSLTGNWNMGSVSVAVGGTPGTSRFTVYDAFADTPTFNRAPEISLQNTNATNGNYTEIANFNSAGAVNAGIDFINVDHSYDGAVAISTRTSAGVYGRRLYVDPDGNIGIGRTDPSFLLSLNADLPLVELARASTARGYLGIANGNDAIVTGSVANDMVIRTQGGKLLFSADSGTTAHMTLLTGGSFGIGVSPSYFVHARKDQNAGTHFVLQNETSGTGAQAGFVARANSADLQVGKYSPSTTGYKIIAGGDGYIYNDATRGNIAILNNYASGEIVMSAGGHTDPDLRVYSGGGVIVYGQEATDANLYIEADNGDDNNDLVRLLVVAGSGSLSIQSYSTGSWVTRFAVTPSDIQYFVGQIVLSSSTPADPDAGASANMYVKGGKLVVQYNEGGTVRYKYLDLTGTGVTWVHTTSAP